MKEIETKEIGEYGLVAFCTQVEKLINEGFTFDFNKNEGVPTSYGSFINCTLYKYEKTEVDNQPAFTVVDAQVKLATEVEPKVEAKAESSPEESVMVKATKAGRPKKVDA